MNIRYSDGTIIDVVIDNAQLQSRMMLDERVSIFGRGEPDAATIEALDDLENNREGSSVSAVCDAMVAAGDITTQRAAEIKA